MLSLRAGVEVRMAAGADGALSNGGRVTGTIEGDAEEEETPAKVSLGRPDAEGAVVGLRGLSAKAGKEAGGCCQPPWLA